MAPLSPSPRPQATSASTFGAKSIRPTTQPPHTAFISCREALGHQSPTAQEVGVERGGLETGDTGKSSSGETRRRRERFGLSPARQPGTSSTALTSAQDPSVAGPGMRNPRRWLVQPRLTENVWPPAAPRTPHARAGCTNYPRGARARFRAPPNTFSRTSKARPLLPNGQAEMKTGSAPRASGLEGMRPLPSAPAARCRRPPLRCAHAPPLSDAGNPAHRA